jgi:hypothetical protein
VISGYGFGGAPSSKLPNLLHSSWNAAELTVPLAQTENKNRALA